MKRMILDTQALLEPGQCLFELQLGGPLHIQEAHCKDSADPTFLVCWQVYSLHTSQWEGQDGRVAQNVDARARYNDSFVIQTCARSKVTFPNSLSWSTQKSEKEEDDGVLYRVEPNQSMGSVVQAVLDRDKDANLLQ